MAIACLLSLLFLLTPISQDGIATWYGQDFLGRHHAAYWHNATPEGAPEIVTNDYLGVAAPIDIPFGTKLLITRKSTCMGHKSPYDGKCVVATVIDRKARYTIPHYYDLWPATAEALGFGPTFDEDDGCVKVLVFIIEEAT